MICQMCGIELHHVPVVGTIDVSTIQEIDWEASNDT